MLEITGSIDKNDVMGSAQPREHAAEHRRNERSKLIGRTVSAKTSSPMVFPGVPEMPRSVSLHIGVVEHRGVVAGRCLVDSARQRAESRERRRRRRRSPSAFAKDTSMEAVIVVLPTPPFPDTKAMTYRLRMCRRMRSRNSR